MEDKFNDLIERAKKFNKKTICFPEGEEKRVASAVEMLVKNNSCKVVLLGNKNKIENLLSKQVVEKVSIIDPLKETDEQKDLADKLYELRKEKGLTQEKANELIKQPMYYACMLLKLDIVDGVVAGSVLHSADVMRPAFQIIKQRKDILKASSCFIMEMPDNSEFGENGFMIFSDCAVNPYPTADELAGIALASRDSAKKLCNIKPRIAMLSYSTASEKTDDENILKIKKAVEMFKALDNKTIIEGEIQADAAIIPEVAKRKSPNGILKGRANVLIFPDINAGNIAYKLVQHITGKRAVGPIIQGLNKPVNDLSRGATAEEIYLTTIITLLQTAK